MASMDQEQAARVWQRVRGQLPEDEGLGLERLITGEWEAAHAYAGLSRRVGSREGEILRRMAREEQGHCAVLQGMYTMLTGKHFTPPAAKPIPGTVAEVLRACWKGEKTSVAAYDSRSRDEEFGAVFAQLRDQEQQHCRWVLELLGKGL